MGTGSVHRPNYGILRRKRVNWWLDCPPRNPAGDRLRNYSITLLISSSLPVQLWRSCELSPGFNTNVSARHFRARQLGTYLKGPSHTEVFWSQPKWTYQDGELYYFGHRNVSDSYIRNDMINDRATYSWSRTVTVNSSLRIWVDNGLNFDSIEQYTSVMERSGKLHRAHTIFTVGRANDGRIYFLGLKVIR
jgi:hypothetical protein